MSALFKPLELRGVTLRHRVILSPMCQYSAVDGLANEWHRVHYGTRAVGGAALVFTEATGVSPVGRISPRCLGIWSDDHVRALQPIAEFVRDRGAVPGIQLAHAGRKGSHEVPWRGSRLLAPQEGGWEPLAPSAIPFRPGTPPPRALAAAEIKQVVGEFTDAARRARAAGFEVIELHMAHGYLLHEFLSPLSNLREDEYGGSFENRIRLPLEITRAVRAVWPVELPLFARVSATDWAEGGWDLDQTVRLARQLQEAGVDLIDCSSGGLLPDAKVPTAPGYQVPFAETIRREAGVVTAAVGLITEARQAEEIVISGQADAVVLGRVLLREPYWPLHAARALGADLPWPDQYLRGRP